MKIAWSLAKVALNQGNGAIRALRAYAITADFGDNYVSIRELFDAYAGLGISRTTAKKDIDALLSVWDIGPSQFVLADLTDEDRPRIVRHAAKKIAESAGLAHLGYVYLDVEDLKDFHTFKRAVMELVLFGRGRDERGGVTISYQGMAKLTNMTPRHMRRAVRRMNVVREMNVAEVLLPRAEIQQAKSVKHAAAKRFKQRLIKSNCNSRSAIIRIRNTYFSQRPGQQSKTKLKDYQPNGEAASSMPTLQPEFGQASLRQTWIGTMPETSVLAELLQSVDVDIYGSEGVLVKTGEKINYYCRFLTNAVYTELDLRIGINRALEMGMSLLAPEMMMYPGDAKTRFGAMAAMKYV